MSPVRITPGAIGSSSLESCCCGRSYFAIKLEYLCRWSGVFPWEGKVSRVFYAMFSRWTDVCSRRSLVTQCVFGWRTGGKSVWCAGTTHRGCAIHPFVVRRPHRYARQSESVRKTGSQKGRRATDRKSERVWDRVSRSDESKA